MKNLLFDKDDLEYMKKLLEKSDQEYFMIGLKTMQPNTDVHRIKKKQSFFR